MWGFVVVFARWGFMSGFTIVCVLCFPFLYSQTLPSSFLLLAVRSSLSVLSPVGISFILLSFLKYEFCTSWFLLNSKYNRRETCFSNNGMTVIFLPSLVSAFFFLGMVDSSVVEWRLRILDWISLCRPLLSRVRYLDSVCFCRLYSCPGTWRLR